MATLSDLRAALAQAVGAALYPAGVPAGSNPSSPVAGCPIRIFQGRPEREALDADLAAGTVNVSVFIQSGGRNTSRYPVVDTVLSIPATTLSWSVAGIQATVTGTVSSPQNVGLMVDGAAFIHGVQPADTLASIAAAIAGLVDAVQPASAAGSVISIPNAQSISGRVGAVGTTLREIGREIVTATIDIWAPSEALRNAVGAVIEPALRDLRRITLADQSVAVVWYGQTVDVDGLEKADLYRRMIQVEAEYASTISGSFAQVLTVSANVDGALDIVA